ncbi:MAG: RHS repeat-associated core domain-containing protein [Nitrolancea sp.]
MHNWLDPTLGRFLSADTVQPNAPGSQGYNLYAYVANNPTSWVDPSGHSTNGDAAGAAGTAAAVSIFSLLLFTSLAAACFAFIGCGPFLVAGALFSSTGGLLVLTGLLIAVFAEVACSLNAACYAATQQIGQTITAYGSAAVAGAWSGGPGDARNAAWAFPVIPVVQSVINEYRYFTQRNNQNSHGDTASSAGAGDFVYQAEWRETDTGERVRVRKLSPREVKNRGLEKEKEAIGGSATDDIYEEVSPRQGSQERRLWLGPGNGPLQSFDIP